MEALKRFPTFLLMMIYLGYLGLQFYQYTYSEDGPIATHEKRVADKKGEIEILRKKIVEAKEFEKTLDAKKEELRQKVKKMFEYESLFADRIDVPVLMKLFITESKRVELQVEKIEPVQLQSKEFYFEQEFKMTMQGEFSQFLQFIHRISQLQRLVRVVSVDLFKQDGPKSSMNYLQGTLTLRAYRYSNSKEDSMAGAFK